MTTGECGSEDTQSGDPCELSATYPDGRCKYHTDHDTDGENSDRHTGVNVRLAGPTHQRVKAHNRDSEVSMSATIDRALDALEREDLLPTAVTSLLRENEEPEEQPCGEYHPLPCGLDVDCPETDGETRERMDRVADSVTDGQND